MPKSRKPASDDIPYIDYPGDMFSLCVELDRAQKARAKAKDAEPEGPARHA